MIGSRFNLSRDPLEQILERKGLVTRQHLEAAYAEQQESGEELGEILLRRRQISPDDLARARAEQFGISLYHFSENRHDPSLIPPEHLSFFQDNFVLPLQSPAPTAGQSPAPTAGPSSDGIQWVAMADPGNIAVRHHLEEIFGRPVRAVAAVKENLREFFTRTQGFSLDSLRELLRRMREKWQSGEIEQEGSQIIGDFIKSLVSYGIIHHCSDIHIEPRGPLTAIRIRRDGLLTDLLHFPSELSPPLINWIKISSNLDITEKRKPQDGKFALQSPRGTVDLRVATMPTAPGESVVVRILAAAQELRTLEELGFPGEFQPRLQRFSEMADGMILVSGPTGSGKSTTIRAIIVAMNRHVRNVVTLEDPVEYQVPMVKQIQVNPEAGVEFSTMLPHIMRADPDVIFIGEIRDPETARYAVEAAVTGHLVLSTVHTTSAAEAVTRLLAFGSVTPERVSSVLKAVVGQRLIRVLCQQCRTEKEMDTTFANRLEELEIEKYAGLFKNGYWAAQGCDRCRFTGYEGRQVVVELFRVSRPIRELIAQGAPAWRMDEIARQEGMKSMLQNGLELAASGGTTLDAVMEVLRAD